ncbi:hypothetical protein LCGC14_0812110 [marine sediment metagenome]|uniref:Uncharacterized protein n=1 Tax=marine sediment metagenome TaxID=412755 RepID=A0A0F9STM6_9ZZZZ
MDREKLEKAVLDFSRRGYKDGQCSHISESHYMAIQCDACTTDFLGRILADETRELRKALLPFANLTFYTFTARSGENSAFPNGA